MITVLPRARIEMSPNCEPELFRVTWPPSRAKNAWRVKIEREPIPLIPAPFLATYPVPFCVRGVKPKQSRYV